MHYGLLFGISLRFAIVGLSPRMDSIAAIMNQDQQESYASNDCLGKAIDNDAPANPTRLVIHSDQNCHYRGTSWIQTSQEIGFVRSMSKKGCSPDHSPCDDLFGGLSINQCRRKLLL